MEGQLVVKKPCNELVNKSKKMVSQIRSHFSSATLVSWTLYSFLYILLQLNKVIVCRLTIRRLKEHERGCWPQKRYRAYSIHNASCDIIIITYPLSWRTSQTIDGQFPSLFSRGDIQQLIGKFWNQMGNRIYSRNVKKCLLRLGTYWKWNKKVPHL